jgi:spermidine synthase
MAFTERHEHKLEIIPPFQIIQCRRADIIEKDGVEVGRTYHRHVRCPGDEVINDCAELQAVANALWTTEVVEAYQAHIASQQQPGA